MLHLFAIGLKYEEDMFFNFHQKEETGNLTSPCLLPTKEMALQYIEGELSDSFFVVPITVEEVNRQGVFAWSRSKNEYWEGEDL